MNQLFTEVKKVVKTNIKIKQMKKQIYLEIYMNKKVKMVESLYPQMIKMNLNNIKKYKSLPTNKIIILIT